MTFLKTARVFLWLLVVAAGGVYAFLFFSESDKVIKRAEQGAGQSASIIPDFDLVNDKGKPVTQQAWQGKPVVVFFGFTYCPDVCPVTLVHLSQWLEDLGEATASLDPYFVTLDPARDKPEVLNRYISNFSDRIVGLTGTDEAIKSLAKPMGIYVKKIGEDDDYTLDHTASVLLLEPSGRLMGTIAYGEKAETAKQKLLRLARKSRSRE